MDKPAGLTSHDVVARVRRALGIRRVGHAGTLDPFATGLLVILVGRATRLVNWLDGEPKVYEAVIRFGTETESDDRTGTVTDTAALPNEAAVRAAIAQLTGVLSQVPPAVSAKQVDGVRAYAAARKGRPLDLKPVTVTVHEWQVRELSADTLDATITCSGGTYVRALARDLGRLSSSAAHLAELRRTRSGALAVSDAMALDSIGPDTVLLAPLAGMGGITVETVEADDVRRVRHGIAIAATKAGDRAALVDAEREVLAVATRDHDKWQPRVVLADD